MTEAPEIPEADPDAPFRIRVDRAIDELINATQLIGLTPNQRAVIEELLRGK